MNAVRLGLNAVSAVTRKELDPTSSRPWPTW